MYDTDVVKMALEALAAGMTEREAAEYAGVSKGAVHHWKCGMPPHPRSTRKPRRERRRWSYSEADVARMRAMRETLGMTLTAIAKEIGCSVTNVAKWTRDCTPAPRIRRKDAMQEAEKEIVKAEPVESAEAAPAPAPEEDVAALKRRIYQLELENDVLRELMDVLKGGARTKMRAPTNAEKAEVAAKLRGRYPMADICATLQISRSVCYYHLARPAPADPDADIREAVIAAFRGADATRGYRYVKHEMESAAVPIRASEKRIRRVMRQEGLDVIYHRRKRHYSSYAGEATPAPANLVARDFRAAYPNFLWVTDITEFRLPDATKVYLSAVIDCFDGKPISWRMGVRPTSELADGALEDAIAQREGWERTVIHDDRGIHYRTYSWIGLCSENGITRSMSAKGCSPDNAACEGFFGRLKNEFFHYRDWRGVTAGEFMERLDAYLRYYCERRPKESLGWMSPNEYRRSLGFAA